MALIIIKFEPRISRAVLIAAALICLFSAWFFIKWNFANAVSSRLDTKRTEFKPVADWLTQMSPKDPQTHFTAARMYQKTFDPGDLTRSLLEYEISASLSPHNYLIWIELGKMRSLNGDIVGAQAAYARALDLAPNYASVQWICGNALIRDGKTEEGFALISKAAAANSDYAQPAVTTALQIFDNDVAQAQKILGDNDVTNAALAEALANQMLFETAFDVWVKISEVGRASTFKKLSEGLIEKFAAARKFGLAARMAAAIRTVEAEKPIVGQISNGGFEAGVKIRNASLFEWLIEEGAQPQVVLNETETRSGKYSLWLIFNSFETAVFRTVSQTVPVIPGSEYEFEVFYRSDLKTSATIKWEIVNALTNAPIAATSAAVPSPGWIPLRVRFHVPPDSDGILIRLIREGCNGPSCPTSGNLAFDDISLQRR